MTYLQNKRGLLLSGMLVLFLTFFIEPAGSMESDSNEVDLHLAKIHREHPGWLENPSQETWGIQNIDSLPMSQKDLDILEFNNNAIIFGANEEKLTGQQVEKNNKETKDHEKKIKDNVSKQKYQERTLNIIEPKNLQEIKNQFQNNKNKTIYSTKNKLKKVNEYYNFLNSRDSFFHPQSRDDPAWDFNKSSVEEKNTSGKYCFVEKDVEKLKNKCTPSTMLIIEKK